MSVPLAPPRRYHRIFRDTVKVIQPQLFKDQLEDTSDIVVRLKPAPRTRKEMVYQHLTHHLDNHFAAQGRKLTGRPLQKIWNRHLDAIKKGQEQNRKVEAVAEDEKDLEQVVKIEPDQLGWETEVKMEPLNDDLRTAATKNVPSLTVNSPAPTLTVFPSRNLTDVRKSYVRRTPKSSPPKIVPLSTFTSLASASSKPKVKEEPDPEPFNSNNETIFTNPAPPSTNAIQHVPTRLGRSRPTILNNNRRKTNHNARTSSQFQMVSLPNNSRVKREVISFGTGEVLQIPQYSTEISLDNSGMAISETASGDANVLDLSDLIHHSSSDTDDGKGIEGLPNDVMFCSSLEDLSEVVVVGQNGEHYRFVSVEDGQFSLVQVDDSST